MKPRLDLAWSISSAVLLAACLGAPSSVKPLPSQEVLERAATQSAQVDSFTFLVDGSLEVSNSSGPTFNSTYEFKGTSQESGRDVALDLAANIQFLPVEESQAITLAAEVINLNQATTYLKLTDLQFTGNTNGLNPFLQEGLLDAWWLLPAKTVAEGVPVTPEVSLLQAQAQIVTLVADHGVKTFMGKPTYHYEVKIDPERLTAYLRQLASTREETLAEEDLNKLANLEATGELWIDATEFTVQRLRWDVAELKFGVDWTATLSLVADIRDHNQAPAITVPSEAKPFNPALLIPTPAASQFEPEVDPAVWDQLLKTTTP